MIARICAVVCLLAWCTLGCKNEPRTAPAPREAGTREFDAAQPGFQRFTSMANAVAYIRRTTRARVIGFGEFHQLVGSKPVRPTLERFGDELEAMTQDASDLIVETWVEEGKCGAQEEVVTRDVREVTERPPEIENQLLSLLTRAKESGVQPHVMVMRCTDYAHVMQGNEVDYEKLLLLIKHKLAELMARVWRHRNASADSPGRAAILIYGGALHNDIEPHAGIEDISYAADARALAGDGYVEVDLLVPEYIEGNTLLAQEPWYPSFARHANPETVLLFEHSPRSFVVILRRDVAPHSAPKARDSSTR